MNNSKATYVAFIIFMAFVFYALPSQSQIVNTYCSTDVPLPVPPVGTGPGTTTSTLNVPAVGGVIQDVKLQLQVNHTFVADLQIRLESPLTTMPFLMNQVGGGGNNVGVPGNGCSADPAVGFILDDNGADGTVNSYVAGNPGSYIPNPNFLSVFNGENQAGTWTLTIFDDAGGDSGTLNCWCLAITSFAPNTIISLAPAVATTDLAVDNEHTVTATIESNNVPQAGVLVDFEITAGPNTGESSDPGIGECVPSNCQTDANGEVSWTYSNDELSLGTDTIIASFGIAPDSVFSNNAQNTWVLISTVPTLSEWGLIAMAGVLGIVGFMVMRRKKVSA